VEVKYFIIYSVMDIDAASPNLCGSKDPPDQIVSYNEKNEGAGQMN